MNKNKEPINDTKDITTIKFPSEKSTEGQLNGMPVQTNFEPSKSQRRDSAHFFEDSEVSLLERITDVNSELNTEISNSAHQDQSPVLSEGVTILDAPDTAIKKDDIEEKIETTDAIKTNYDNLEDLLNDYLKIITSVGVPKGGERPIGTYFSISITGKLIPQIQDRLLKFKLLKENSNILQIPFIFENCYPTPLQGNVWCKEEPNIKTIFLFINKILCECILPLIKFQLKKVEPYTENPEIYLVKKGQDTPEKIKNIKDSTKQNGKVMTQVSANTDLKNTKIRLLLKCDALSAYEGMRVRTLGNLKYSLEQLTRLSELELHSNTIQAYLMFEILFKEASMIIGFSNEYIAENSFIKIILKEQIYIADACMKLCELLTPYAIKITNAFEKDLDEGNWIKYTKSCIENLLEEPDNMANFETFESFTMKNKTNPQQDVSTPSIISNDNLTKEEIEAIQIKKLDNKRLNEETNSKRKTDAQERKLVQEKKEENKRIKEATKTKERGQMYGDQYKKEIEEIEQKKLEEHFKKLNSIPYLLSQEQVNQIIASLNTSNLDIFETIYLQSETNDKMITHKQVINCANFFHQKWISIGTKTKNEGLCKAAIVFFDSIKQHKHAAHSSDSGSKMPINYLDAIRPYWILPGITTEEWSPKTPGDYDALTKHLKLRMNELFFKNQNSSIETKK